MSTPDFASQILAYEFCASFIPWLIWPCLAITCLVVSSSLMKRRDTMGAGSFCILGALAAIILALACLSEADWVKVCLKPDVYRAELEMERDAI